MPCHDLHGHVQGRAVSTASSMVSVCPAFPSRARLTVPSPPRLSAPTAPCLSVQTPPHRTEPAPPNRTEPVAEADCIPMNRDLPFSILVSSVRCVSSHFSRRDHPRSSAWILVACIMHLHLVLISRYLPCSPHPVFVRSICPLVPAPQFSPRSLCRGYQAPCAVCALLLVGPVARTAAVCPRMVGLYAPIWSGQSAAAASRLLPG